MSGEPVDRKADEVANVVSGRRREALDAGLSWDEAVDYAEGEAKTEDLRHLIELHCPPKWLAKILL